eukprot:CAMPEP_0170190016 /NCGR_PEP_ID=MMETSP0040_2-20121228/48286_1 /TAXON_ID=641309 /ORGANISM="Lotharella oceanica, Strain CCMP622" /LENGTH=104 /DNA_ID=CAMNT_0010437749 /DNA_START=241 /DNA_END=554 /DNA_ORIENTATION=+
MRSLLLGGVWVEAVALVVSRGGMRRGGRLLLSHLFSPPVPGETPDRSDNTEDLEMGDLVLEINEAGDDDDEPPEDAGDLVREQAEPLQHEDGADRLQPVGHDAH